MPNPKRKFPNTSKATKGQQQATKNRQPTRTKPTENPLLKIKATVSFQVNIDFLEKIEAIRDDSGFESTSELCREAVRTFIRKEAWRNRMITNYMSQRDGGKTT